MKTRSLLSHSLFNLGHISDFRTELMGVSTIAILLCHAPSHGVILHPIISSIFIRGGVGVDIFLFLSGLGLFYSLEKQMKLNLGSVGIREWYKRRYKRVLFPYLIIILPLYFIICCIRGYSFGDYLLYVTTIGFWIRHNGVWFIALLLPLYFISPVIYQARKRVSGVKAFWVWFGLMALCVFISLVDVRDSTTIFHNVQFCLSRVPCFLLGMYAAPYIKDHRIVYNPLLYCVLSISMGFLLKRFIPSLSIGLFWIIPIVYICCCIFSSGLTILNDVTRWFGEISLESYLFNVTLPLLIMPSQGKHWVIFNIAIDYGNYLPYVIVITLGTILAYLVHRLVVKLLAHN